ncbi:hypothetical protein C8Q77DRAFT_899667 [Trametes polyzona]|nr:hypothetical protein C8Q77DRAFT_899667 [Trametes polyzona]
MATYYVQRRSQSGTRASASSREVDTTQIGVRNEHLPATNAPADLSIYIFPSPASVPPSPATSSSSAPTEFDFSSSADHRLTSRRGLYRRDQGQISERSLSASSGPARSISEVSSLPWDLPTPSEEDLEIDREPWEIGSEPSAGSSDLDRSWSHEGELRDGEVASGGHPYDATRSPDDSWFWYPLPTRSRQRSRTQSRVRTVSISSLAPSLAQPAPPHPRIHIPLLSLFSSLLSINLDEDPALRLLTTAEPGDAEAVLFPGQSSARLLASIEEEPPAVRRSFESDSDTETESASTDEPSSPTADEPDIHGLPRLLLASISDPSAVALRSLRAGLSVQIPVSATEMGIPLWRVLGEVYSKGSQAWKEIWSATPAGE